MSTKTKKALKFLPMIAVMIFIFIFSAMPGDESSRASGVFLKALVTFARELTKNGISEKAMGAMHLIIRKCAHFTEYAALGASAYYALFEIIKKKIWLFGVPGLISFLYACTDEFHQYHVPGRYGTFSDVLIDLSGAVVGIVLFSMVMKKKGRK